MEKSNRRIVEVDDSGWGDLLGGTFLCFNDVANHKHTIKEIPVEFFQPPRFQRKKYLDKSRELAEEALKELNINRGDNVEFHVCTGYINNAVASLLTQQGFKVSRRKIEGETQVLVEEAYENYVRKLTGTSNVPPSGRRFFSFLKWVREDLANRERFVKTGWKSWNEKWRTKETQLNYRACINCKWLRFSGPHAGCFYGHEYHGWMSKKALRIPTRCPHWERREKI